MPSPKKRALGKGLNALVGEAQHETGSSAQEMKVPIEKIKPNPNQPRIHFNETELNELCESIREHGVLQPLLVRKKGNGYEIIAGERRFQASKLADLTELPVIVKDVNDEEMLALALIENLQREDLDPVEEAMGFRQLMDRCGLTQEEVAKKLAKSRSAIANSLRLLALPAPVLELLRQDALTAGHAKAILGLPGEDLQCQAASQVVAQQLNVRQTEALCRRLARPPVEKPVVLRPALPTEVEVSLREVLGNEVKVDYKDGKGSLTLHFYSDDQLKAFANLLGQYNKEQPNG